MLQFVGVITEFNYNDEYVIFMVVQESFWLRGVYMYTIEVYEHKYGSNLDYYRLQHESGSVVRVARMRSSGHNSLDKAYGFAKEEWDMFKYIYQI